LGKNPSATLAAFVSGRSMAKSQHFPVDKLETDAYTQSVKVKINRNSAVG
jgi:hypothetical protein